MEAAAIVILLAVAVALGLTVAALAKRLGTLEAENRKLAGENATLQAAVQHAKAVATTRGLNDEELAGSLGDLLSGGAGK